METIINNFKQQLITFLILMSSFCGVNAIAQEQPIIMTSHAATSWDSFVDIEFKESNGSVSLVGNTEGNASNVLNSFIRLIRWMCLGGSVALLGMFALNIIKMGTAGTNVQARAAAKEGLIWSGASAALLTIATTIFFFIQNSVKV